MIQKEFINKWLKVAGVTGCILVLNQHVNFEWWEGGLLGFSVMLLLD